MEAKRRCTLEIALSGLAESVTVNFPDRSKAEEVMSHLTAVTGVGQFYRITDDISVNRNRIAAIRILEA